MPQPSRFIQLATLATRDGGDLVALDERGGVWIFKRDVENGRWICWWEEMTVQRGRPERREGRG